MHFFHSIWKNLHLTNMRYEILLLLITWKLVNPYLFYSVFVLYLLLYLCCTCFCICAVLASVFVLYLLLYLCAAAGKCRKFRLGEGQLTTEAPTSTTWRWWCCDSIQTRSIHLAPAISFHLTFSVLNRSIFSVFVFILHTNLNDKKYKTFFLSLWGKTVDSILARPSKTTLVFFC